jgi:hypothetical protein
MQSLGIHFGENIKVALFNGDSDELICTSIPGGWLMQKSCSAILFDCQGNPLLFGEEALRKEGVSSNTFLVDRVERILGKSYEELKNDPYLKNLQSFIVKGDLVFDPDGKAVAIVNLQGKETRFFLSEKPHRTFCRTPEKDTAFILVGGEKRQIYLPEQVVALVLAEARKNAESYLTEVRGCADLDYDWVTIAFPTCFTFIQRDKLKMAAILSGIPEKKLRMINEPTAATFDVVYEVPEGVKPGKNMRQTFLVLNIGSYSFDLTLVETKLKQDTKRAMVNRLENAVFSKVDIGAKDIDAAIVDWILNELKKTSDFNGNRFTRSGLELLRLEAQDAITALSEGRCQKTWIKLPGLDVRGPLLSVDKLNEILKPIVDRYRTELRLCLETLKISDDDFSTIILLGGHIALASVKSMIADEFQAPLFTCPICKEKLYGHIVNERWLLENNDFDLTEEINGNQKGAAWWYTHSLHDANIGQGGCCDHLVFADGTHYENMGIQITGGSKWRIAEKVIVTPRNHYVVESVDYLYCITKGAAISPLMIPIYDDFLNPIRLLVKGTSTPQTIKPILERGGNLPLCGHKVFQVSPWEWDLHIDIIQDQKQTLSDHQSDANYSVFSYLAKCHYYPTFSEEARNVYFGFQIMPFEDNDHIELFAFENESDLADWLLYPEECSATPLLLQPRTGEIIVDTDSASDDVFVTRVWGVYKAQSNFFAVLQSSFDLLSLLSQSDGYLSEETARFKENVGTLLIQIYLKLDAEADRISKMSLFERDLEDTAKAVVDEISSGTIYTELKRIVTEDRPGNLCVGAEGVKRLLTKIGIDVFKAKQIVVEKSNELDSRHHQSVTKLINLLDGDWQRLVMLTKSGTPIIIEKESEFIKIKNRLDALDKFLEIYTPKPETSPF